MVVAVMSHRDPPLLRRLVGRVREGRNTVVLVHHDPRGAPHGLTPDDRTLLVPDPGPCDWGRMNQAEGILRCLEETRRLVPEFSWMLLVSGQDYPAQHLRHTEHELAETSDDAYLRYFPVSLSPTGDEHPWQPLCRRRYLHELTLPRDPRIPGKSWVPKIPWPRRHPFVDGVGLYIADTWINLSARAVDHVLEQRVRLKHVERYFSRSPNPDEALLPTMLLNNADGLKIVNDRKRYIKWPGPKGPEVLGLADLPAVAAADAFFARKVDSTQSAGLLDGLDDLAASGSTGASTA